MKEKIQKLIDSTRTIYDIAEQMNTTPEELLRAANRYYNAVNIDDPCVILQYIGYWDIINYLEANAE